MVFVVEDAKLLLCPMFCVLFQPFITTCYSLKAGCQFGIDLLLSFMPALLFCCREIKDLSEKIINSEPVRFAIEVSLAVSMNNYVRFFKLIRSATYLNACILLRYFYQVRSKALFTIVKSHCPRSTQSVVSVEVQNQKGVMY